LLSAAKQKKKDVIKNNGIEHSTIEHSPNKQSPKIVLIRGCVISKLVGLFLNFLKLS
jgi:hypothetical protein